MTKGADGDGTSGDGSIGSLLRQVSGTTHAPILLISNCSTKSANVNVRTLVPAILPLNGEMSVRMFASDSALGTWHSALGTPPRVTNP
jgi:hypothetical protein